MTNSVLIKHSGVIVIDYVGIYRLIAHRCSLDYVISPLVSQWEVPPELVKEEEKPATAGTKRPSEGVGADPDSEPKRTAAPYGAWQTVAVR